jgi:hypothetical protein
MARYISVGQSNEEEQYILSSVCNFTDPRLAKESLLRFLMVEEEDMQESVSLDDIVKKYGFSVQLHNCQYVANNQLPPFPDRYIGELVEAVEKNVNDEFINEKDIQKVKEFLSDMQKYGIKISASDVSRLLSADNIRLKGDLNIVFKDRTNDENSIVNRIKL